LSPLPSGENVMIAVENGDSQEYVYQIPENHPSGLLWMHPHLHGAQTHVVFEEALETTIKRTCQLAKRQKTWFRNKHNSKWLNDESALHEALTSIYEFLG
jgi:tRNA A37 N6-isopentenylltransferase MiaA